MVWVCTGSGRIEMNITKNDAHIGHHQGQCDDDVKFLSQKPYIKRQLKKLDPQAVKEELKGYGAWSDKELEDHNQNLQTILWLMCGDITEAEHERKTR